MAILMNPHYNPFRDFDDINRAFFGDNTLTEFKTDIRDMGDSFVLEADLPGFKKEDIKLSLNGETMTIKATRHSDFENQDKKSGYLRCERSYGTYTRTFDVSGIETNSIRAAYNNGVLTVTLPKRSAHRPEGQTITID